MIDDPLALAGLIAGVAALGFWLEGRFAWARQAGARGGRELALSGVVVGLLGYAVGNDAGLAMAAALRAVLD